jgi:alcohol dehydrogenase class IV
VILTGDSAALRTGIVSRRLGMTGCLLVTDARLVRAGLTDGIVTALAEAGLAVEVFDGVLSEPSTDVVDAALSRYRESGCDGVVAIGGGSAIDTGKAVAVLASNGGRLPDYEGYDRFRAKPAPLVAVPTTAGTGSEVTRVAVVTDRDRMVKMLLVADELMPGAAIVDPSLTLSCPPAVTASAGVDALTHAIEAYLSRRATPLTDDLAIAAARKIHGALPRVWADGSDRAARSRMMVGQLQAGMAFSNASVALVHAMARPLGAVFGIPHGIANAMLLPTVLRYTAPAAVERMAILADGMGVVASRAGGERTEDLAIALVEAVERLCAALEIPSVGRYGVNQETFEASLQKMAEDALASGSPANNPRVATAAEIVALYRRAF